MMSPHDKAVREIVAFVPDNDEHLRLLREQVASRSGVIPFVGAGLSVPFGYKGWTAFLFEQSAKADRTEMIKSLIDNGEYEEAAEIVRDARGDATFEAALEAEYTPAKLQGKPLDQGAVARLPWMFDGPVVTTNFDRVLETVFGVAEQAFERVAWGANISQTDKAFREGRHLLLKIHGDIEEVSQRILTKSEYMKHYGTNLPDLLYFMFTAQRFLFLGCSLGPDRTLEILGRANKANIGVRHFALVEAPEDEATRQTRNKFLGDRGVLPIWYPKGRHELIEPVLLSLLESIPGERRPRPRKPAVPARLSSPLDPRLQHRTSWCGRTQEVKAVLAFLQQRKRTPVENVCSIEGAPGIGKTEVCKEVLRRYLQSPTAEPAYYVDLSGARSGAELLDRLANSFDIPKAEGAEQIMGAVAATPGVIYLDNLEDVLEDDRAIDSLKSLADIPQMKIVVSSRRRFPDDELQVHHVPIGKLLDADAIRLFVEQWKKSGNKDSVRESDEHVRAFVTNELSCHALSIVLVAAQGWRVGSFALLREAWKEQSLRLAKLDKAARDGGNRLTSLNTSLEISLAAVQTSKPVAMGLWGLLVFFPAGLSRSAWQFIAEENPTAWEEARDGLLMLHLAEVDQQGTLSMLAPIRQFILAGAGGAKSVFITEVGKRAFNYFTFLALNAEEHERDADHSSTLTALLTEFPNLAHFLSITTTLGGEWPRFLSELSSSIANYYQHRAVLVHEMLEMLLRQQEHEGLSEAAAMSSHLLGTLKSRLGQRDAARQLFEHSLSLYRALDADVGIATNLLHLGNLERESGNLKNAHELYEEARTLFEKNGNQDGLADTFQRLGDLRLFIDRYDEAQELFVRAAFLFHGLGEHLGLANALRSQGDALRLKGEALHLPGLAEDAELMYTQALDLFVSESDDLGAANAHYGLGLIYTAKRDWTAAREHNLNARTHYLAAGTPMGFAKTCVELARVAHVLGEERARDNYFREATDAAAASDVPAIVRLVENVTRELGVTVTHKQTAKKIGL